MPRSVSPSEREARAKEKARADRNHDAYVSRTYGLERGEYARMLDAQDNRCAMCRRVPRKRRLAVDHDHFTGKVRGLLCYTCNHMVVAMVEFDAIAAYHAAVYISQIAEDVAAHQLVRKPDKPPEREPDDLPF